MKLFYPRTNIHVGIKYTTFLLFKGGKAIGCAAKLLPSFSVRVDIIYNCININVGVKYTNVLLLVGIRYNRINIQVGVKYMTYLLFRGGEAIGCVRTS